VTNGHDLLVVGAGPAGCAAAITAARAGAKVLLVDKQVFPRPKACGDAVTPPAVRDLIDLGMGAEVAAFKTVDRLQVHTSRRNLFAEDWHLTDEQGQTRACVVSRTELDHRLVQRAEEVGVELRLGDDVRAVEWGDGVVTGATLGDRQQTRLRAAVTIAADGARSRLARTAGLPRRRNPFLGVATRVECESDRAATRAIDIFLGVRSEMGTLAGYGWAFPLDDSGGVNLGVFIVKHRRGFRGSLPFWLERFVASLDSAWNLPRDVCATALSWPLPMGLTFVHAALPGMLVAGDALGAANPLGGEGIGPALRTGRLAAECALAGLDHGGPRRASVSYNGQLRGVLGRRNRVALPLGRAVMHPFGMRCAERIVDWLETGSSDTAAPSAAR
jgi:geranylgeranyl reductase family protein